jgi:hypothetical protein
MVNNLNLHTSMKLLLQFVKKLPFFPLKRSICYVQSKFQIISEIDAISMIVEYNNIKCSSVWYHFDPVTVYYKDKTISNPNSDTGMNYVLGSLVLYLEI